MASEATDRANRPQRSALEALTAAARERILILDGAMGTQIQGLGFDEDAFPRRPLRRLRLPPAGQQRPADPDPAGGDRGDPLRTTPSPAPTSSRPTPSPRPSIAQADYGMEDAGLRAEPRRRAARAPRRRPRRGRRTASAASSPARSARPTAPPRSRPTSTTPASAPSPSTTCASPTASSCAA